MNGLVIQGRNFQIPHDLGHGFLEYRRRYLAAVVRSLWRIKHNQADGPGIFRRTESAEGGYVLPFQVSAVHRVQFLRCTGFTGHMIARHLGIGTAAFGHFFFHHVLHVISHFFGNGIAAVFHRRHFVIAAISVLDGLDNMRFHHFAAIGYGTVGLDHLQRRDSNALADGHGGHVDGPHILRFKKDAASLPGKLNARRFTEAEGLGIAGQCFAAGQKTDMGKSCINGKFQNIHQPHIAVGLIVPVPDSMSRSPYGAGIMPHPLRIIGACCQRRRCDDRLERGARFVNIYDGPVFEFRLRRLIVMIGIIGGTIS